MIATHTPSLNAPLDRALLQRAARHRYTFAASAPADHSHAFTILVPVDFSPDSDEAVALAAKIGASLHARFVLLHILPRPTGPDFGSDSKIDETRRRKAIARMSTIAGALRHLIRDVPFEIRLRNDCAHLGIVREALATGADLIVMARHGRAAGTPALLGRTVDYAVRHAPCAVLLAPEPDLQ